MEMAAWIQAISTIILLIITGFYVHFTKRIIHSPHSTVLKPCSIKTDVNKVNIHIENIGPNSAYAIRVESILVKNPLLTDGKTTKEFKIADGPYSLKPNQKLEYRFEDDYLTTDLTEPFIIQWKSTTGEKSFSIWYYNASHGSEQFREETKPAKREYKKIVEKFKKENNTKALQPGPEMRGKAPWQSLSMPVR